jgi:hypothetical protein
MSDNPVPLGVEWNGRAALHCSDPTARVITAGCMGRCVLLKEGHGKPMYPSKACSSRPNAHQSAYWPP